MIDGPGSLWRDIKVFGDYAYAVSEGGCGIQVFDLSQIDAGIVTLVGTVTTGGTTATHNVAIDTDSGYLYRCGGGSSGLRIYDLNANPNNPPWSAPWTTQYVHDAEVLTYTLRSRGRQADRLLLQRLQRRLDVHRAHRARRDEQVEHRRHRTSIYWPGAGFSHQCWLSPDQHYLYSNDELDENGAVPTTTYVFDVSNPRPGLARDHLHQRQHVDRAQPLPRGNLLFEANYRSGLRVFDMSASPRTRPRSRWFDT